MIYICYFSKLHFYLYLIYYIYIKANFYIVIHNLYILNYTIDLLLYSHAWQCSGFTHGSVLSDHIQWLHLKYLSRAWRQGVCLAY